MKEKKETALIFLLIVLLTVMSGCHNVAMPADAVMSSSASCSSGTVSGPVDPVSESEDLADAFVSETAEPAVMTDAVVTEASESSYEPSAVSETDADNSSEHVHLFMSSVTLPTCTTDGTTDYTCSCGASYQTVTPALGHDWGAWTVRKAATCNTAGERKAVCRRDGCGAERTESIAKTPHAWTVWQQTAAPTCTNDGSEARHCSVCGAAETRKINKLNHSWGAWVTDSEPTCTVDGRRHHTCSRCGQTEYESITKTGHDWGDWTTVTVPTCTAAGTKQRSCSKCGEVEIKAIDKTSHDFGPWVTTPATCATPETKTRTCSKCGYEESQTIGGVAGHDWVLQRHVSPTQTSAGYDEYKCTVCQQTKQDITHDQLFNMEQAMAAANQWLVSKGCVINYNLTPSNGGYFPPNNPTHKYLAKYGGQSKLNSKAIECAEDTYYALVASYGEEIMNGYHIKCYIVWQESTDEYLIYILRGT